KASNALSVLEQSPEPETAKEYKI
ncbi:hypothetical protein A2U01_0109319, partial [Trifolium medium]|nr:hypothetical protein [Trifolium medium]